jgi:hypothetical protein
MTRSRIAFISAFVIALIVVAATDARAACLTRRRYDSTGGLAGQATTINVFVNTGATRGIQNTGLDIVTATEAVNSALARYNEASVGLPRLVLAGYVMGDTLAGPRMNGITIDGEYTDCSDPMLSGNRIGFFRNFSPTDNDDVLITMGRPSCHPDNPKWSTNLSTSTDFEATLLHELGHALGLGHTDQTPESTDACTGFNYPEDLAGETRGLMDPSINDGLIARQLWRDDIEGLRRKYNTPDVCINDADCGLEDCNEDFECGDEDDPPTLCSTDDLCITFDPAWRCVDGECEIPPTKARVHRPYFQQSEIMPMPAWLPKQRFPELEDVGCYHTPSMSATPIDVSASPAGAGLGTDHQIVTMVDEAGYVMMYPATFAGFCEKGEYRVWPFGEGRNVYQRPVTAVGEDHGMVAWIGSESFESLSTRVYWRPLDFTGACQFQWNDGGPFSASLGSTKGPLGLAYNASTDEFVLTYQGSDAKLRMRRISTSGVSGAEITVPATVVEPGSGRCHNGTCVVPARTMEHCPAWVGFNINPPIIFASIGSDCARASAGYRDSVPDLDLASQGFTTHKRRTGLTAVATGVQELRIQSVNNVAIGGVMNHPFVPPAPAPDWAGDLGSQRGLTKRYRHFHLAPDNPMVPEAATTCVGPNCPVNCGGIPDPPVEFAECDLEGVPDGQGAGCRCATTDPSAWPDESAIADGAHEADKYCLDAAPDETEELVCGKAPNGYHDMCLRCGVDTMEGCDCSYEDQCLQFGEDLNCFGSVEADWEGDSGKCWHDPLPDHLCAENCSSLGRVCFFGDYPGLADPIDPAQCVDPNCGPTCEEQGLVCDPNPSECIAECDGDAACEAHGYPWWYACDLDTSLCAPAP